MRAPVITRDRLEGTVKVTDGTRLVIDVARLGEISYPVDTIQALSVVRGKKNCLLKGLLLGTGAGVLAGALASGQWLNSSIPPTPEQENRWWTFTVAGAALGAAVGAAISEDRWVNMPPGRLRVGLQPAPRGGLQVVLTVGF